jgi:peptidoglycan/LPS O-acetylase OafA/YrhL
MYGIVTLLGVLGILRGRAYFNIAMLLIVIWYLVNLRQFFLLHQPSHMRLGLYFMLGALFYINRDLIRYNWIGVFILLAGAVLAFGTRYYNVVFALTFSYIVLYISFHPRLRFPNLAKHGDFSYGLYLYAFPVTQLFVLILGGESPWLVATLTFGVTLVLAVASWRWVEKPSLALKGQVSNRIQRLSAGNLLQRGGSKSADLE